MERTLPRYPLYVPSKGRYKSGLTAKCLIADGVPFTLVVEPHEEDAYRTRYPEAAVLILPWRDLGRGGLIAVRNWIKDYSVAAGHRRHWQIDDNIRNFYRLYKGKRLYVRSGVALAVCEDFVDRYENVAIAGPGYVMFASVPRPPFTLNAHVYSCTLILNELPNRWRLEYNDDTDMCLQVLADGWCTVHFNAFLIQKAQTMATAGGNTPMYRDDGRLVMARMLERQWPGVVTTERRYLRPQHVVNSQWRKFDTKLIRRKDVDWDALRPNEYGMRLTALKEVRSDMLKGLLKEQDDDDARAEADTA